MVGVERFELPTHCSQSSCATRLRYTPKPVNLSMLRTLLICVNPFPSFWATKNPINSKGHPVFGWPRNVVPKIGAPGEIRTPDRPVRSRVLYPAELRARCFNTVSFFHIRRDYSGHPALHPSGSLRKRSLIQIRSRRICRTPDRPVRSRVLYPAELRARCVPSRNTTLREGCELSVRDS